MMNKPSLITGTILFFVGLLMVIIGLVLGSAALTDQDYEEIINEGDFSSTDEGTYEYMMSPTSSFGNRIEVSSKTANALVFDLTIKEMAGSIYLNEKGRITPYSREMELLSFETYTFIIDFEDDSVPKENFSISLSEKTLSDSAISSCCLGMALPGLGGLLMLVGIILVIVGLIIGRKKEVLDDPWNKPQDTYPTQPPVPQSQTVRPQPPLGGYNQGNPPQGPYYGPPPGGDGTFSPNILRPPPGP